LSALCSNGTLFTVAPSDFAASLAASSALSFPAMSMCPGIHTKETERFGCSVWRDSILFNTSSMIAWPDCFAGFAIAFIAA
jgi:hypothetical protein